MSAIAKIRVSVSDVARGCRPPRPSPSHICPSTEPETRTSRLPLLSRSAISRRVVLFSVSLPAFGQRQSSTTCHPVPSELSERRSSTPSLRRMIKSSMPSLSMSAIRMSVAGPMLSGSVRTRNWPERSLVKTYNRPCASSIAASASPSPSRSAHTKLRSSETPLNSCSSEKVPSPLFLSTTGGPDSAPSIRSRWPSDSRSAAHAPT